MALVVLHLSACTSWQPSGYIRPTQFIEEEEPDQVRITTIGDQIVIRNPEVRGDSIVGEGRSVAVSDMRRLEIMRFSALKTIGIVFLFMTLPAFLPGR